MARRALHAGPHEALGHAAGGRLPATLGKTLLQTRVVEPEQEQPAVIEHLPHQLVAGNRSFCGSRG